MSDLDKMWIGGGLGPHTSAVSEPLLGTFSGIRNPSAGGPGVGFVAAHDLHGSPTEQTVGRVVAMRHQDDLLRQLLDGQKSAGYAENAEGIAARLRGRRESIKRQLAAVEGLSDELETIERMLAASEQPK